MERKLQNLRKAMDSTTHKEKHFTEVQKNNIRKKVRLEKGSYKRPNKYVMFGLTAVAVTILALLVSTELNVKPYHDGPFNGSNQIADNEWEERNDYVKNDKELFSVYPDPTLSAGKPYGYMFHFTEPFETFEGKELAIYAHHKENDERITVLPPKEITEPSSGYPSLERFTTTLEVPEGGLWRYEVFVDTQFYGDVILLVNESWEVSSTFNIPVTFGDGTEGEYVLVGEEGRIGFLVGSGKEGEAEAQPIIAGEGNKYMWHFWGGSEEFEGKLRVVGINEKGEEHKVLIEASNNKVWEYPNIGVSPNNGADTHVPSGMEFPTAGLWKLNVYIGDEIFGEIIINVEES